MELLLFCSELDSSFRPFFKKLARLDLISNGSPRKTSSRTSLINAGNSSEGPPWMPNFVSIF